MSISLTITRELNGAQVVYQFVADTINKADEMARFLAGAPELSKLPQIKVVIPEELKQTKEQAQDVKADTGENRTEKEPEAKKPQLSGTASTPTSQPEASDTSKAYGYEEVKTLIVQVLKDKGRDTAAACLARVGLKVLPKDCKDADLLGSLGKLASDVLAGSVDVFESVEA